MSPNLINLWGLGPWIPPGSKPESAKHNRSPVGNDNMDSAPDAPSGGVLKCSWVAPASLRMRHGVLGKRFCGELFCLCLPLRKACKNQYVARMWGHPPPPLLPTRAKRSKSGSVGDDPTSTCLKTAKICKKRWETAKIGRIRLRRA